MRRLRISTRGMILAVLVIGFDSAAMSQAVKKGRFAHSVVEYTVGFGFVLLLLNVVAFGVYVAMARKGRASSTNRLNATPSPLLIVGLYVGVLALAILSVLFFTSGIF